MCRRGCARPLLALLLLAVLTRAAAWARLPVVHDEVNVIAYGLGRAAIQPDPLGALVFATPVTVSNGLTPLWFWLQAGPAYLFGLTSKVGLRVVPFLLGLLGVALAWATARRLFGRQAAFLTGATVALGSLFVYTNTRGEFTESLLLPCLFGLLLDSSRPPLRLRAALWPGLLLGAYFGKGLLVWGAWVFTLALGWWGARRGLFPAPGRVGRLALLAGLPLLPAFLWLAAAQAQLFGPGRYVITDIGPVDSVWDAAYRITVEYGRTVKWFMVGGLTDSLYVYSDARTWPVMAFVAAPVAAAWAWAGRELWRAIRRRRPRRAWRALLPWSLGLPPLAAILLKGAMGARFHLLYLAVVLPYAAPVVVRWWRSAVRGRAGTFLLGGGWLWTWPAVASARVWADGAPTGQYDLLRAGVGAAAVWGGVGLLYLLRRHKRVVLALGAAAVLAFAVTRGVWYWGREFAWEPWHDQASKPGSARLGDRRQGFGRPHSTRVFSNPDYQWAWFYLRSELARAYRRVRLERLARLFRRLGWLRTGRPSEILRLQGYVEGRQPPPPWVGQAKVTEALRREVAAAVAVDPATDRALRRELVQRARRILRQILFRHPDDPSTVERVGLVLYQFSPRDRRDVARLWAAYLRRHPERAAVLRGDGRGG